MCLSREKRGREGHLQMLPSKKLPIISLASLAMPQYSQRPKSTPIRNSHYIQHTRVNQFTISLCKRTLSPAKPALENASPQTRLKIDARGASLLMGSRNWTRLDPQKRRRKSTKGSACMSRRPHMGSSVIRRSLPCRPWGPRCCYFFRWLCAAYKVALALTSSQPRRPPGTVSASRLPRKSPLSRRGTPGEASPCTRCRSSS